MLGDEMRAAPRWGGGLRSWSPARRAMRLSFATILGLALASLSACNGLLFDEPFGRSCRVADDVDGPFTDSDDAECLQGPAGEDGEQGEPYVCRSTGPSVTDAAVCVPNLCATGPLHLVAPFQVSDLKKLGNLAIGQPSGDPVPGDPGLAVEQYYEPNCFAGLVVSPTAVPSISSDPEAGELSILALGSLGGDLVIDTNTTDAQGNLSEDGAYGVATVLMPDLQTTSGRVIIAPADTAFREDIVIVIDGTNAELAAQSEVDLPSLCEVNGLKRCDDTPTPDNTPTVRLGGAGLRTVNLTAFVDIDQLNITAAPALGEIALPALETIAHRLTIADVGPDLRFAAADGGPAADRWGRLLDIRLGSEWEPGRLVLKNIAVTDPREPIRLFLALVDNEFRGAVLIGNNPPDANPALDGAAYWEEAPQDPIPAEEYCADLERFPGDELKCPPGIFDVTLPP